jgi:hypothetical protein
MAKMTGKPGNEPALQTIEELQKRYEKLHTRKIQAETQRDTARKRLEELKAEARAKYQTDDVEQLRQKLEQMRLENEQKRAQYQADLDGIERELAAVEQRFAETEPGPDAEGGKRP